jgi:hypothetical protein
LPGLRILMFDLGEAILPSRPQSHCSAVSSGGQGWPPPGGHPKGSSLTAASTAASSGVAGQKTMGVVNRFQLPVSPPAVGKRNWEAHQNRALDLIRKRDPAQPGPGSWFSPRSAFAAATSGPKHRRCNVHNGLTREPRGPTASLAAGLHPRPGRATRSRAGL